MHTLIIVVFSIHFALTRDSLVSLRTNYRFYNILLSFSVHFDRCEVYALAQVTEWVLFEKRFQAILQIIRLKNC